MVTVIVWYTRHDEKKTSKKMDKNEKRFFMLTSQFAKTAFMQHHYEDEALFFYPLAYQSLEWSVIVMSEHKTKCQII
jgi:hypothetical protein